MSALGFNQFISKVSIIGAGRVGSALAYSLLMAGAAGEILLVDKEKDRAEGEAMDLNHAMPFASETRILSGSYEDCAGSNVIVITAGAAQEAGQSRLAMAHRNVQTIREIAAGLRESLATGVVIVVANPVDVLTYAFLKETKQPWHRVFGAGTILDTARFRHELGTIFGLDPRNVNAYIAGEHGDTEVPLWSITNITGIKIHNYLDCCNERHEQVALDGAFECSRTAAYEIIEKKGSTYYAIAAGTQRLVESVLRDQRSIHTVSIMVDGLYGIHDVCLSLPCVIGSQGIVQILELPLSGKEEKLLYESALKLRNAISQAMHEQEVQQEQHS